MMYREHKTQPYVEEDQIAAMQHRISLWLRRWISLLAVVLWTTGIAGCGAEQSDLVQPNSAAVSLSITLPDKVAAVSGPSNRLWAAIQRWFLPTEAWSAGSVTDLAFLRVDVNATDLSAPVNAEVSGPFAGNVVTIPLDVPVGSGRVFTVSGLDATRARIFIGQSDPLTLAPGGTATVDISLNTVGSAGSLTNARDSHSATLLLNGQVLVVGGNGGVASSESYNPATNRWTPGTNLTDSRSNHTATLLQDGKVLVAAGDDCNNDGCASALVELFDPATRQWTLVSSLTQTRIGHTATRLQNGKVLVAGGFGSNDSPALAELFDPATQQWANAGGLESARSGHTATLLQNGQVLVVGGLISDGEGQQSTTSIELFNPATNQWTAPTTGLSEARNGHTATLLPNGQVLIVGGFGNSGRLASAELFGPATGQWTQLATGLSEARSGHTATLLRNGQVLIIGGRTDDGDETSTALSSAELFDPATTQWTKLATGLSNARSSHTATLLPNGQVLVSGGIDSNFESLVSAELLDLSLR